MTITTLEHVTARWWARNGNQMKPWDDMTPRERDAWVASEVFGGIASWEKNPYVMLLCPHDEGPRETRDGTTSNFCKLCGEPGGCHDRFPAFSSFASADYLVLKKVRDEWKDSIRHRFFLCIDDIWFRKFHLKCETWGSYEPGDYSHAAWLALNEGRGSE